jgi:hypothetical protein
MPPKRAVLRPHIGSILLEVISGSHLPPVDNGTADPFIMVAGTDGFDMSILIWDLPGDLKYIPTESINDLTRYDLISVNTHRSINLENTINPVWNWRCEVTAHNAQGCLLLQAWDYNSIKSNKLMCSGKLSVDALMRGQIPSGVPFVLPMVDAKGAPGGEIECRISFVPRESPILLSPLEEVSQLPKGHLQFKTFVSQAARDASLDVKAANMAACRWFNQIQHIATLVKIDTENTPRGATTTVWFRIN